MRHGRRGRLYQDLHRVRNTQLDDFVQNVPVGLTGQSLQSFADCYLDSLLTYGNALGEMLIDNRTGFLGGLQTVPAELVQIRSGSQPLERQYWLRGEQESATMRKAMEMNWELC